MDQGSDPKTSKNLRIELPKHSLTRQVGEEAVGAEGVGVLAEVADDLEEALLGGGALQPAGGRVAEEALAGEAEDGVVLGGGPCKVRFFGAALEGDVAAGLGAGPEPGEEDVDGEVGGAGFAEEGLGLGESRGGKAPAIDH